jgi:Lrp/AsnC family transcriptional regulator, leucine-responsive regulatory protein
MEENTANIGLDDLDIMILQALQTDASLSNAELARRLNLSQPATHNRVKRLERRGYIRRTVALLDRELLGHDLLCFVQVIMQAHHKDRIETFQQAVQAMPQVLECHHLTGEYDFLLKVIAPNRKELERLLVEKLSVIPGVGRIQTNVVLSEVKFTTTIPLE